MGLFTKVWTEFRKSNRECYSTQCYEHWGVLQP